MILILGNSLRLKKQLFARNYILVASKKSDTHTTKKHPGMPTPLTTSTTSTLAATDTLEKSDEPTENNVLSSVTTPDHHSNPTFHPVNSSIFSPVPTLATPPILKSVHNIETTVTSVSGASPCCSTCLHTTLLVTTGPIVPSSSGHATLLVNKICPEPEDKHAKKTKSEAVCNT